MYQFKVIVLDDKEYKLQALKKCLPAEGFVFQHVLNVHDLLQRLSVENYDLIFIDLRLHTQNDSRMYEISVDDLEKIAKLSPNSLKYIYTEFTDEYLSFLQKIAFRNIISDWIDYNQLKSNQTSAQIVVNRIFKDLNYNPDASSNLSILHLSDLHFGKQFFYAGAEVSSDLSELVCDCIFKYISKGNEFSSILPDIIIVSGDLSNTASIDELTHAKSFLLDMKNGFENGNHSKIPIIITPGNHDLNWNLSIPERNRIEDGKLIFTAQKILEYSYLKWTNFESVFLSLIEGSYVTRDAMSWWCYNFFSRFGIRFVSFNSSSDVNYYDRGVSLSKDCFASLKSQFKNSKESTCLIAHHPVSEWAEEHISKEILTDLYNRLGVRLIFSGHRHSDNIITHSLHDNKKIIEIRTGSPSARDQQSLHNMPHFRIVQLTKNNNLVWNSAKCFEFTYDRTRFIHSGTEECAGFSMEI